MALTSGQTFIHATAAARLNTQDDFYKVYSTHTSCLYLMLINNMFLSDACADVCAAPPPRVARPSAQSEHPVREEDVRRTCADALAHARTSGGACGGRPGEETEGLLVVDGEDLVNTVHIINSLPFGSDVQRGWQPLVNN